MNIQRMMQKKDIVSGTCIVVFSVFIFFSTFGIKHLTVSRIGSAFVPRLVAIGLFLVGGTILINGVRNKNDLSEASEQPNRPKRAVFTTFLSILFYVSSIELLGFLISNTIYLILQFSILIPKEKQKIPVIISVAILLSSLIYGIFVYGFQLYLPTGLLG